MLRGHAWGSLLAESVRSVILFQGLVVGQGGGRDDEGRWAPRVVGSRIGPVLAPAAQHWRPRAGEPLRLGLGWLRDEEGPGTCTVLAAVCR